MLEYHQNIYIGSGNPDEESVCSTLDPKHRLKISFRWFTKATLTTCPTPEHSTHKDHWQMVIAIV